MRRAAPAALAAALLALAPARPGDPPPAERLARARDWLYQLQRLDPAAVRATRFDVLVTDPSRDGSDGAWWDAATVRALREGRVCLAYLSIGEAEDYRGYWRPEWRKAPPPWLGPENPDWKGNFAVRFWDPGWRAVLLADDGPLARVVAAGWDGVYLDLVDVYDVWADKGELDRDEGRARMATLVRDLAAFARASRPGFVVVPQNGADLAARDDVLAVIDGLALEDTFFLDGSPRAKEETDEVLAHARRVRAAKKAVLTVDYVRGAEAKTAYERSRAEGFVPYATVRALDRLTVTPGLEPD